MDTPTAKRIVIGSLALVVVTAEIRKIRDGKGPTIAPPVGGLAAGAILVLVAGPAPTIASTFALIALVGQLAVDVSDPKGSALFAAVNNATNPNRKGAGSIGASGVNQAARNLSEAVSNLSAGAGTRWWSSSAGLAGALSGAGSSIGSAVSATSAGMVQFKAATGQTITCAPSLQPNLERMIADALAQGVRLTGGCWRSSEEQARLRKAHCKNPDTDPASACSPPTAPVGKSQHERGLAIDFDNCKAGSKAHRWLTANAARYGLYQLPSESWHWSTTGS